MKIGLTFSETFDKWYDRMMSNSTTEELLMMEGIHPDQLDVGNMSHKYFTDEACNFTVDNNANTNEEHSYNNYFAEITKGLHKIEGYYLLHRYAEKRFDTDYADELLTSILTGDLYFHDPTKIQIPYCYAYSTTFIMTEGRPYGQLKSVPPQRSDSFMAEVIETTMDLSQEFAGAIAMGDLIVNLCYYLKREGYGVDYLAYSNENCTPAKQEKYVFNKAEKKYIINQFQKFVHVMNNKFRLAGESPFTNISIFDEAKLHLLFDDYLYPDGSSVDYKYVMAVQELFIEFFSKGDPSTGLPYRFPVVTINFDVDENNNPVDEEFARLAAHYNRPLGAFNIYPTVGTKVASCCRLVNDFDRMEARQDSFGNGGLNIGSHRVVTINLPRIAIEAAGDTIVFFRLLSIKLECAKDLLLIHREEILERRVKKGFLKFFDPNQLGWFNLDGMFSTFGINGVYEMCEYMGYPITSEQGQNFVSDVLKFIDRYAVECSKETGHSFNVEEIPAENTGTKLASKDSLLYGKECKLYSNQFIPLIADVPILQRLKAEGKFMHALSGGAITHINVLSQIDTDDKMYNLMLLAMHNGVEHFAVNYGFNECEHGHVTIGGNAATVCPICNSPIKDHITRVVGFFTRVSAWSPNRKEEFKKRQFKEV